MFVALQSCRGLGYETFVVATSTERRKLVTHIETIAQCYHTEKFRWGNRGYVSDCTILRIEEVYHV